MTGSRSYLLPDQGDPCRLIISKLLEGRALPSRQQICKAGFAQHNMRGSTCTFKVQATSLCSQFEAARPRKVARSHPSPPGISTKLDRFRKGPSEAIRRLFAASSTPAESSTEVSSSFAATQILPVRAEDGSLSAVPSEPGIYAFYNSDSELQYVGLSRKISDTVAGYSKLLPELTHSVKFVTPPHQNREQLVEVWKEWMQDAVQETGKVPPGNQRDNDTWTPKRQQKSEIKLTPGKGVQDLNCSVTDLIEQVVKANKVVAFVKGTRRQPQCGFSYKVLSMLNELGANYEVLNVLDETYNPGLREAIKEYSQWPTIPQLYVDGELVGGADIVEEMHSKGELKQLLAPS